MTVPVSTLGSKAASGSGAVPAHVYQAVADASARTGVSFSYLLTKASTESGFDTEAKARTSSATGLYQFIEGTWLDMVDKHGADYGLGDLAQAITRRADGTPVVADRATRQKILDLRKDPGLSAAMAAEYAGENKAYLTKRLGREVTDTDLYLAHFLGAGGAEKFLKALAHHGGGRADSVVPQAAATNENVFYTRQGRARSLAEVYANFSRKFEGESAVAQVKPPADVRDASAAQTDDGEKTLALARPKVTQPGAIPGASAPFLTTYLLSALESPLQAERTTLDQKERDMV